VLSSAKTVNNCEQELSRRQWYQGANCEVYHITKHTCWSFIWHISACHFSGTTGHRTIQNA